MIITSIVVAATAAAVSSKFDSFSKIGGIIGSSVSAAFLILLGLMNVYILFKLIKQMQKVFNLPEGQEDEAWKIEGGGPLFSILKKMFKLIDRYVASTLLLVLTPADHLSVLGRCILSVFCLDSVLTPHLRLPCSVSHLSRLPREHRSG